MVTEQAAAYALFATAVVFGGELFSKLQTGTAEPLEVEALLTIYREALGVVPQLRELFPEDHAVIDTCAEVMRHRSRGIEMGIVQFHLLEQQMRGGHIGTS